MKKIRIRGGRSMSAAAALVVLALLALVGSTASFATSAGGPPVPPPPANPTEDYQMQNLGQVVTAIKAYYGDTVSGTNPDGTPQHLPSPTGAYAQEVEAIESGAGNYLAGAAHLSGTHKAVVLDVDDTTLNTYNYEIDTSFVYNPTSNALFVNDAAFPAVIGMPALVNQAKAEGFTIFFITGRPESQRSGTTTNLTNVGYPAVTAGQLFLKDLTDPWLSSCAPSCTTIQYKSLTRAHIQSLGYKIYADFGDQFSDLKGGYAGLTVKMPNPMYYLP
ncbi:MAG TPA: HAD family acid phosphatase [Jatrophihabitantaceae bacterium]